MEFKIKVVRIIDGVIMGCKDHKFETEAKDHFKLLRKHLISQCHKDDLEAKFIWTLERDGKILKTIYTEI